jgi:serine/threonine-protein kinase RsbW
MPADADGLLVTNDLAELSRIAAWLDAAARAQGLSPELTQRLHVCSVEAVTNIIMHGCPEGEPHAIRLALARAGDTATLEIEDDGVAFDPRRSPDPQPPADLATARIGGWGIPIMRRFSDEMGYCRTGGRNVLTLVFRLPATG